MKKNSLIDYLLYISIKLISKFLMILPGRLIIWLGGVIGNLGFYLDRKHRSVAYTNIKRAFADKKDPREINNILRASFCNFGQSLLELLRLPIVDSKYIERLIKFEGKEHVDKALEKRKGLIILGLHFGNWEIGNAAATALNHPYKIIARVQDRYTKLDNLLNSYRQVKEGTIISRGRETRDIIKSFRNNEIVIMVVDQGGRDGMPVKFFDKTASMHTGALRLALKFDVPVMMFFIVREKGERHKVILRPLSLEKSTDLESDVRSNLETVIKLSEQVISKYPEQYLWFYKAWKYSDERAIVILSDGKTGHLRQSQAISKTISQELDGRKIDSQTNIVEVKFKNNFSRIIVTLYSFLLYKGFFQGRLGYLRNYLERESFNNLTKLSADFIISCGASVAPINLILSGEIKSKSIVIMRPGILSFKKFDLAIMPKHDLAPKRKNITETHGALNLIDEEYLNRQSGLLINRFPSLKSNNKKRIGILIGGETKDYTFSFEFMNSIIEQLKDVSEKLDAEILLTTSRRTPNQIDDLLKNHLDNYSRCRLLVIANENNIPEAVGGILATSQIIVTSSDSISMISEAASSGKVVVVFKVQLRQNRRQNLRHQRFLDNLSREGYIILVEYGDIKKTIQEIIQNNKTTKTLRDSQAITDAIRQVL